MKKYVVLLIVLFSCFELNVFAYDQIQQGLVDKAKALDSIYRKRVFNSSIPLPTAEQLNFANARFQGRDPVDLSGFTLTNAIFDYADLTGVNLNGANLDGASFKNAYLTKANLQSASLISTDFTSAHLDSAYFTNAYLDKTIFTNAYLMGATFSNTTPGMTSNGRPVSISGADMNGVTGLTLDQIAYANNAKAIRVPAK